MKKTNSSYLAKWIGIPVAVVAVLILLSLTVFLQYSYVFVAAVFVGLGVIVAIPMILESKMKKSAAALEETFPAMGFHYQYKFTANNAVYYIDQGGKMGVVYKYNPAELQFVDLDKVTDVRVDDGKFGMGTSRVSCVFLLEGKKIRINTLTVSRGALSMKDSRVVEAISKANALCNMINAAKANAKASAEIDFSL